MRSARSQASPRNAAASRKATWLARHEAVKVQVALNDVAKGKEAKDKVVKDKVVLN